MRLTPALSAYLDALRFLAALAVVLGHMMERGFDLAWMPLAHFGHEAVIVFFVMSGLIITATTNHRHRGWRDYAVARAARIYSVAVPAVVFSLAVSWAVLGAGSPLVQGLESLRAPALADAVSSVLFLNESWWISFGLGPKLSLNGPYWSLCYEVWYYILFGVYAFGRGRQRWLALGIIALLAGPAVMVMFPIWCIGAWMTMRPQAAPAAGGFWWPGFIAAPILMVIVELTSFDLALRDAIMAHLPAWWHLGYSQRFPTDLLLGAAVAWHLHAFQEAPDAFQRIFAQHARWIGAWAGFSFTLYLFHMPLVTLLGAAVPAHFKGALGSIGWAAAVVGLCWLISLATERQLPRWRRSIGRLLLVR